jgi:hypothetical protein
MKLMEVSIIRRPDFHPLVEILYSRESRWRVFTPRPKFKLMNGVVRNESNKELIFKYKLRKSVSLPSLFFDIVRRIEGQLSC